MMEKSVALHVHPNRLFLKLCWRLNGKCFSCKSLGFFLLWWHVRALPNAQNFSPANSPSREVQQEVSLEPRARMTFPCVGTDNQDTMCPVCLVPTTPGGWPLNGATSVLVAFLEPGIWRGALVSCPSCGTFEKPTKWQTCSVHHPF